MNSVNKSCENCIFVVNSILGAVLLKQKSHKWRMKFCAQLESWAEYTIKSVICTLCYNGSEVISVQN